MRQRPLLWLAPVIAVILAFGVFPLGYSLVLSFFKWDLAGESAPTFVGLQNFRDILLTDHRFWANIRNTILIVIIGVVFQLIIGLGTALLLVKEIKAKVLFRTVLVVPMMIAPVVVGAIWKNLFHYNAGPVNHLLSLLGLDRIDWLSGFPEGVFAIIIADTWEWTPFIAIALLAGLQSLPQEPFEAAQIDGASKWQIFRFLTLPLIKPIVIIVLLLRVIDLFKIFDTVFILTGGGPGYSTETISVYIYKVGLSYFRVGYSSALSYILLFIVTVPIIFLHRYFSSEAKL